MTPIRRWRKSAVLVAGLLSAPALVARGANLPPELSLLYGPRASLATAAGAPSAVTTADVDGDGLTDVLAAGTSSGAFTVYRNLQAAPGELTPASFAAGLGFGVPGEQPRLAVADLDGDGLPDVVVANARSIAVQIFRNLSTPTVPAFALLLVVNRSATPLPAGASAPADVVLGDVDGDGRPEVLVGNPPGAGVSLFRNTSSPGSLSFAARQAVLTGILPERFALGDLDGDGRPDLAAVAASQGGNSDLALVRNTGAPGSPAFALPAVLTAPVRLAGLALADVDQDSKLDVLSAGVANGSLYIWRNTAVAGTLVTSGAGGSLTGPSVFAGSTRAVDLAVADVEGDGRADVILVDAASDLLTALANDSTPGTLQFETLGALRTGDGASALATTDLDGDGAADLAVADTAAGSVHVRRNTALLVLGINASAVGVPVPVTDDTTPAASLSFQATSENEAVIPSSNVGVSVGAGGSATLDLAPAPNAAGSLRVRVQVQDLEGAVAWQKLTVLVGCIDNVNWPDACPLSLEPDAAGHRSSTARQTLTRVDEARWFRFAIQPESQLYVALTELSQDYDLFVFRDIQASYDELLNPTTEDLALLGAEFAPAAFSPAAFSPAAFSPAAFSPAAFSPAAFSPAAFSPAAFSPAAFSPAAFSPAAFSPAAFSPAAFSPAAFSPAAFSPAAFSPAAFSPAAFSGAQTRSLVAVSAFTGTAGEGVFLNTWGSPGNFYVCVRGRNGAFDAASPFRLDVVLIPGGCSGIAPLPAPTLPATAGPGGGYRTLVLADFGRMNPAADPGIAAELAGLRSRLDDFLIRPEVAGVFVDVGADAAVAFANAQADATAGCVQGKNLVAGAIRDVVVRYRALNPALEFVLLLGSDQIIPYFRHPDTAGLASEQNFIVPVLDNTSSQASLRLGYVLSQDAYGAVCEVAHKFTTLPLADLPVGRLVETPAEILGLVDAYLLTSGGQLPTPTASLVTGYDFLVDAAEAIDQEFRQGMGTDPGLVHDQLIAPRGISPQADPVTTANWSATELEAILFGRRHDLIFLAGHYNDGSALAADYTTELKAATVAASTVDMRNTLVFGAGCHVGYNTVDPHSIQDVTQRPDWAQALARKGVTAFIGGTGYQYGDTELLEYHERLYLEFTRQLRSGTGPVSVGQALVAAKRAYLRGTPLLRGIHEKTLLETTLFGFPMLTLDLPGTRLPAPGGASVVPATTGYGTDPGATLKLQRADLAVVIPALTPHSTELQEYGPTGPLGLVTATHFSGPDGQVINPAEPVLPLVVRVVTSPNPGEVLRGVGFRNGTYADETGVRPLTGMPATEVRGVGVAFQSEFFYPVQPWSVGYFDAVCGDGSTRLNLLPVQHQTRPDNATQVVRRRFSELGLRLFYSGDTTTYVEPPLHPTPDTPALADAPSIARVSDTLAGDALTITAQVVANPSAGIQEVWVTYTATTGAWHGQWQSLDLAQQADSRDWQGTLTLPAWLSPTDVRYLVQAVNGVGLVTLNANHGLYFTPNHAPAVPPARVATTLTFDDFPLAQAYGETATFSAVLATSGGALAGERVVFGLGDRQLLATTDAAGRARVTLSLLNEPATYQLQAGFAGSATHERVAATTRFTISPQSTRIVLEDLTTTRPNLNVRATLSDLHDNPLASQSLFFVLTDPAGQVLAAQSVITDYAGRASLGVMPLGAGVHTLRVYFNGNVPLTGSVSVPTLVTSLRDSRYEASEATGTFTFAVVAPDQTVLRAAARTAKINVAALLAASQGLAGATLTLLRVESPAPSGATVGLDDDGLWIIYQPPAGPDATGSFTYTIADQFGSQATGTVTVGLLSQDPGASQTIISIQPGGGGSMLLTFIGIPGLLYDVQAKEDLAESVPWVSLGQVTAGANGEFTFTDADAALYPVRYYRSVGP